jgi:hypothetical protein
MSCASLWLLYPSDASFVLSFSYRCAIVLVSAAIYLHAKYPASKAATTTASPAPTTKQPSEPNAKVIAKSEGKKDL